MDRISVSVEIYISYMCGIVGIARKQSELLRDDLLESAIASMRHRGPDDSGLCHLFDPSTGTMALFGHRRLSVLDVSAAGHQPMSIDNGQITIVYNGEIYNYRDIRKELEGFGYRFKSNCDTEVILAAYKKWGSEFIHRCNGMFAMAIWDGKAQKILLYRDRVGIKPLYFGFQGNWFYFGSVLSAIARIKGFQKHVNQEALLAYTWIGYVPGPYAMFEGIEKLLPGHLAELDFITWKIHIRPYWQLSKIAAIDDNKLPRKKMDEYIDELESLLYDSVRLRLVSDVPLGAFLSGGIDSSVIVSLMKKVHSGVTRTFSIGFDVEEYNEAPMAKAIAKTLGTEHQEQILSSNDIKEMIKEVPHTYDEPFSDSSCLATMLLSRMTRESVTVALSGDGGDELFLGAYHRYKRSQFWKLVSWMPPFSRRLLGKGLFVIPLYYVRSVANVLQCRDFGQYYYSLLCICQVSQYPTLIGGDISRVWAKLPVFTAAKELEECKRSPMQTASTLDFYNNLPDDYLVKVDRASMAYGLEVRVPLLDYRIVEFSRRVPYSIAFFKRNHKHLLKTILGHYVPRDLWDRPKKGFEVPLAVWFRGDLYDYLHENLLDNGGLPFTIFNKDTVEKILEDHKSGKRNNYRILWGLLSLAMWYRNYINS